MNVNLNKKMNFRKYFLDTKLFRIIYIILTAFEMLAFVDIISLVLKSTVLIWGFLILVHNFLIEKLAFKVKYKYLLWLFLILMIITSIIHITIWFIPNIVITYFTAVCFFMFYGIYTHRTQEQIEQEMIFILKFLMYFSLISGSISLVIIWFKPEICLFKPEDCIWNYYNLGIFKNRLTGIYVNPNMLACAMIIGIVSCDILCDSYICQKLQKKINKYVIFICLVVNFMCLFLSDSNASFVFMIIYCTVRVFCNMFFKNNTYYFSKLIKSILITFGFSVLITSGSFALRETCQNFISNIMTDIYRHEDMFKRKFEPKENNIIDIINNKSIQKEQKDQESFPENVTEVFNEVITETLPDMHIGRENYEVSSGRINLFRQGIEIFKHNPWFGIGRANLGLYGKKYLKNGLSHSDLHNAYLTILVSYGIIGFVIFAIFSFLVALDICKYLFECVNLHYFNMFCKLFSLLVAYCAYCMFEKAILFDMTFMVGIFWVMLGYTVSYVYNIKLIKFEKK